MAIAPVQSSRLHRARPVGFPLLVVAGFVDRLHQHSCCLSWLADASGRGLGYSFRIELHKKRRTAWCSGSSSVARRPASIRGQFFQKTPTLDSLCFELRKTVQYGTPWTFCLGNTWNPCESLAQHVGDFHNQCKEVLPALGCAALHPTLRAALLRLKGTLEPRLSQRGLNGDLTTRSKDERIGSISVYVSSSYMFSLGAQQAAKGERTVFDNMREPSAPSGGARG